MPLSPNYISQPRLDIKSVWLPLIHEELKNFPQNPPKSANNTVHVPKAEHKYLRCKTPHTDCLKYCACVLLKMAADHQQPKR